MIFSKVFTFLNTIKLTAVKMPLKPSVEYTGLKNFAVTTSSELMLFLKNSFQKKKKKSLYYINKCTILKSKEKEMFSINL